MRAIDILQVFRNVLSSLPDCKSTFTNSWAAGRLLVSHIGYSVISIGLPDGAIEAPHPVEIEPKALFWDLDDDQIHQLGAADGKAFSPFEDKPEISDREADKFDKSMNWTYRFWKKHKTDDPFPAHLWFQEFMAREDKLVVRFRRYQKVGIWVPEDWADQEPDEVDIFAAEDRARIPKGIYFNLTPLLLLCNVVPECKVVKSDYKLETGFVDTDPNETGSAKNLWPANLHHFKFTFKDKQGNRFPVCYAQAPNLQEVYSNGDYRPSEDDE